MSDGDLYERYQSLRAIIAVLAHELRNPLHSATLLVEAMALPSADGEPLRRKLRDQLVRLDALVSATVEPAREMALQPDVSEFAVVELLESVHDGLAEEAALAGARVDVAGDVALSARADRRLVARILTDVAAHALATPATAGGDARVSLVASTDGPNVTVHVEDHRGPLAPAARRAPFHVAGGGVELAIARYLAQLTGGHLRLDPSETTARFALRLPRA